MARVTSTKNNDVQFTSLMTGTNEDKSLDVLNGQLTAFATATLIFELVGYTIADLGKMSQSLIDKNVSTINKNDGRLKSIPKTRPVLDVGWRFGVPCHCGILLKKHYVIAAIRHSTTY